MESWLKELPSDLKSVPVSTTSQDSLAEESEGEGEGEGVFEPSIWSRRWGYNTPEDNMTMTDAGTFLSDRSSDLTVELTVSAQRKLKGKTIHASDLAFYTGLLEWGILFESVEDSSRKELTKVLLRNDTYQHLPRRKRIGK